MKYIKMIRAIIWDTPLYWVSTTWAGMVSTLTNRQSWESGVFVRRNFHLVFINARNHQWRYVANNAELVFAMAWFTFRCVVGLHNWHYGSADKLCWHCYRREGPPVNLVVYDYRSALASLCHHVKDDLMRRTR